MGDKQEGGTELLLGWLVVAIIIVICLYIMYRLNTYEVHSFLRWIRYAELWLISLFTPDSFTVTLHSGDKINIAEWRDQIRQLSATQLDLPLMSAISDVAMVPIKWFAVFVISIITLWTYKKGPGTHYTEVFNLDTFIQFQSKAFPVIAPFVKFNPAKQPPRPPGSPVPAELPAFAEALGPEEWIVYNQIPIKDKDADKNAIYRAFARQLGGRWKGYESLDPYKQILLAAFCLKAARKRNEADQMMGRLANCWSYENGLNLSRSKGLLSEARKVLRNKDLTHSVLKKCNQHAWETTALMRALLTAREEGGVMAPAQFVWLRAHDRNLWYPLNNLGRQSNHPEAIGAVAHFKQEKRIARPIPKPKVQDAVTSLITYINSLDFRPLPSLDYSYAKNKRGIKKPKTAKA